MTNRYVIASMLLESDAEVEITEAEFEAIIFATAALLHCIDAEEKFDAIIENYRELEGFMLDQSLQSMLSARLDDVLFQVPRSTTSRKLGNFLSSVRLYHDSVARHAKAITNEDAGQKIKNAAHGQYDGSLDYRIMEALRNHSQHHALPVYSYSVRRWWDQNHEFSNHEFKPNISVSELAQNPDFKKTTMAEMQKGPDILKLKPMLRNYVEGLSTIHQSFRDATQTCVLQQMFVIEQNRQRFTSAHPNEPDMAISTYQADDEGMKVSVEHELAKTLIDYVSFLQRKNRHLVNFARRRIAY
jgi:hypothetical protein